MEQNNIHKTNNCFLAGYITVLGLSTAQFGQILVTNTAVGPILGERLGWDNTDKADTYIASLAVFGMAIGSFAGGILVKGGRRRIVILLNLLAIVGVCITLIMNFWAILLGKFVWALAVGILSTAGPLMVDETVPAEQLGFWALSNNFFIVASISVTYLIGIGLPDSGTPEVYTSNYWRIVYGSPLVNQVIVLICFIFIYRTDSIRFLITKKRHEEALKMIKCVYAKDEDHQQILQEMIDIQDFNEKNKLTLPSMKACVSQDGLWQPQWVCFAQAFFNQLSGVNAINVYSVTIFTNLHDQGSSLNPQLGVQLIGLSGICGCLISPFVTRYPTRRQLFIGCYALMAIEQFFVGLFIYLDYSNLILVAIFAYYITYQATTGSATWTITGELCNEKQLGLVVMSLFLGIEVMALFTNSLINSSLHTAGTFWLFGICCAIGSVFLFFTLKETKGLTKEQQRTLYYSDKQKQLSNMKENYPDESTHRLVQDIEEEDNINASSTPTK